MTNVAIMVEELSKRYVINHQRANGDGLRHLMQETLTAPFRWFREKKAKGCNSGVSHTEEFWALKNATFDINQGEVVGIIGRNGAGKSTLLKILSRITEPTKGRITIDGRVASLLEVGTGFHPELTGRENIFLNGAILGMSRADIGKRFDEIVAFAEVERFLDTPVKRYSSGMYVRLAFAVAAHLEPEILIVDEVLAVGDAQFQKKCLGKMKDVATQEKRTILFVSHNMAAVSQLCSKVVWLHEGSIKEIGATDQIIRSYMECSLSQTSERRWEPEQSAPGDDRVRVVGARIVQNGCVTGVVDINLDFRIEIDFITFQHARNLLTGVNLFDANGQCIFNSVDWRDSELQTGRFCKYVTIPGQTLAEGKTSVLIRAVFYEPDVLSAVIPDALVFDAVDSEHPLTVRGHYKDSWPGVVRLRLTWSDAELVSTCSKNKLKDHL